MRQQKQQHSKGAVNGGQRGADGQLAQAIVRPLACTYFPNALFMTHGCS